MKIKVNTRIIANLKPCQDRLDNWNNLYPDFNGDVTKFLKLPNITHKDKLWVTLRLIPLEMRVVFALDASFAAAYAAYAANAAAYAADAAYAANAAAYATDAAAYAAAYAADAAYAAAYATDAAAYAAYAAYAANAAAYAAYAANAANEQNRQIEALIYLIKGE